MKPLPRVLRSNGAIPLKLNSSGYPDESCDYAVAVDLCQLYSRSTVALEDIALALGIPDVWGWMRMYDPLAAMYEDAQKKRADNLAEEVIRLAEEEPEMIETKEGTKIDAGWVANQKLRIETRKWLAKTLMSKKYGDSTTLRGDPNNPLSSPVLAILDTAMEERRIFDRSQLSVEDLC